MFRTLVRACVSLALTLTTVEAFLLPMPQCGAWRHKTISLSEKIQFPLVASRPIRYRRAGVDHRASAITQRTFTRSKEVLEPTQTQLQHEWFDQWGFGKPDPPKEAKAGFGGGIKKVAKKGARNKANSPPQSAQNSQVLPVCSSPGEDLVLVFRADMEEGAKCTPEELKEWGVSARRTVDEHLHEKGAVLLRGLPMRSAEEFSHFWSGCLNAEPALVEGKYVSSGPSKGRDKIDGIDTATNVPPQFLLLCHNEMSYNPLSVERIALYCIQEAPIGGESLVARNSDLNKNLPASVKKFLEEHGGIVYTRKFYDARNPPSIKQANVGSWQEKCFLEPTAGPEGAQKYFSEMGFTNEQIKWGENGSLIVENYHPGFVKDPETGEDVWFNIVHTGSCKAGDGTPFPKKVVQEIQKNGWDHTYAWKLKPGDWLMLDNFRVQHGRLPFVQDPRQPRILLTVYSGPKRSF